MLRYKALLTAACLAAFMFELVLTPSVLAFLAMDSHIPKKLVSRDGETLVMAYVSIDRLDYDKAGEGVAYLDGTFYVHNYDQKNELIYGGELRLAILEPKGDGTYHTLSPDAKEPVSGSTNRIMMTHIGRMSTTIFLKASTYIYPVSVAVQGFMVP